MKYRLKYTAMRGGFRQKRGADRRYASVAFCEKPITGKNKNDEYRHGIAASCVSSESHRVYTSSFAWGYKHCFTVAIWPGC